MSVYDESSMYGTGVFEMMRTFNKKPFRLEAHLDRLLDSARATYLSLPYTFKELKWGHEALLRRNELNFGPDDEIRTLINCSRGVLPMYAEIHEPKPWVMMTAFPLNWVLRGHWSKYDRGVHAIISSQRTIPAEYLDPKVKNRSRLHYKLAELEVQRADKEAFPLLLDGAGYIAESSGSNFFIVKRGRLITPEPRNCLRGISRNFVLSLARGLGIDYRERNIEPYDALTADEAFFTATPWCITPCTRINGQKLSYGWPGKMTLALMDAWKKAVGVDFVEQARKWDATRPQPN